MSEFKVSVVRIADIEKHPNADSLSMTKVHGGYPVIFRTDDYQLGDLAAYVPVDSLVPTCDDRFSFLSDHAKNGKYRVKAKKLRGIFSMGLLVKPQPDWLEGRDVETELGIEKYEEVEPITMRGEISKDPGVFPVYDIEGLRKYMHLLEENEDVIITEKIHGCNARMGWHDREFHVGSRTQFKKLDGTTVWADVANKREIPRKMKDLNVGLYFEVYGQVQDMKYGIKGCDMVVFDAFDLKTRTWWNTDDVLRICNDMNLPYVPILHRGPWSRDLVSLAEGKTILGNKCHVREGFVVKPIIERWHNSIGRVILKLHGEGYLLRK